MTYLSPRGTEEHFGCEGRIDILNSTLGKALGGAAGMKEIVYVIIYMAYVYMWCVLRLL